MDVDSLSTLQTPPSPKRFWHPRDDGGFYRAKRTRPFWAAVHLLVQGALSTAVYQACLAWTARRGDAGRLYANWELSIPFIPAMIVPYLSVYLLFILTYFAARDVDELLRTSLRLTCGVMVSAACFLLFPLRSGFVRPPVEGAFAPWFRLLDSADAPFNMAPSLHVTTTVILGATLAGVARGGWRCAVLAWCAVIVLSTLFTWQHHVIDVITGLTLGLACIVLIRPRANARPTINPLATR